MVQNSGEIEGKMLKPVTHVIFDMDGLLLDTETIYEKIFQKIASQYGKEYTLDIRLKVIGRPERDAASVAISEMQLPISIEEFLDQYHPLCREELTNPAILPDSEGIYEDIYEKIAQKYGKEYTKEARLKVMGRPERDAAAMFCKELDLPLTVDEFLDVYHPMCREELTKPNIMPGVERLVRHLAKHKVPIAIATSGNEWLSKIKTQNYTEFFALFDHVVYGSNDPDVKEGKPAPDIYLVCASRFPDNPPPEKVLVFEDAPNGVEGATRAGMQVVMIPGPLVVDELKKKATVVLTSMTEFHPDCFGLPPYDD